MRRSSRLLLPPLARQEAPPRATSRDKPSAAVLLCHFSQLPPLPPPPSGAEHPCRIPPRLPAAAPAVAPPHQAPSPPPPALSSSLLLSSQLRRRATAAAAPDCCCCFCLRRHCCCCPCHAGRAAAMARRMGPVAGAKNRHRCQTRGGPARSSWSPPQEQNSAPTWRRLLPEAPDAHTAAAAAPTSPVQAKLDPPHNSATQ